MRTFKPLEQNPQFSSIPATSMSNLRRPSPSLSSSQHLPAGKQVQPMSSAFPGHTFERFSLFPPVSDNARLSTIAPLPQEEKVLDRSVSPTQYKKNRTGLPDGLKTGVESLSGVPMDDVHVHYSSAKPAQVRAWSYAQGTEIYVGPGQEKYVPHEAWHVVQQKQGRVRPTIQMKGIAINNEQALEREADSMGERAVQIGGILVNRTTNPSIAMAALHQSGRSSAFLSAQSPVQRVVINPDDFLAGANRLTNQPDAAIDHNRQMSGFGGRMGGVGGVMWRTHLTWDPTIAPHQDAPVGWLHQGRGVRGIVGPEHPQGSPASGEGQANATLANNTYPNPPGGVWVGGHILNAELGGVGSDVRNIHVFSTNANHTHASLENKAKEVVNEKGQFIWFETVVVGPGFPNNATLVTALYRPLATDGHQYGNGLQITFNPVIDYTTGLQPLPPAPGTPAQADLTPAKIDNITIDPNVNHRRDTRPWQLTSAPLVSDQAGDYLEYDRSAFPAVNVRLVTDYLDRATKKHEKVSLLQSLLLVFTSEVVDTASVAWSNLQIEIEEQTGIDSHKQDTMIETAAEGKLLRRAQGGTPAQLRDVTAIFHRFLVGWVRSNYSG